MSHRIHILLFFGVFFLTHIAILSETWMDCFLSSLLNALISLYHYFCHPLFQPEILNYFKCLYLCFQFFLVLPSSFYCGRNINIIPLLSCFLSWRHKITSYHHWIKSILVFKNSQHLFLSYIYNSLVPWWPRRK